MIEMADGHTVAIAVVGREGAVGILSVLGPSSSDNTAVVRAAGTAARIPASRFHNAFSRSPAIRHAVQIHVKAMLKQLQLGSACNALHPVESRMARWLLQLRDRVDHDVLPLTQHALSQILGVRRTTVTLLMRNLRARGAIRADRRGLIEIDPARLAAAACECHNVMHLGSRGDIRDEFGPISRGGSARMIGAFQELDQAIPCERVSRNRSTCPHRGRAAAAFPESRINLRIHRPIRFSAADPCRPDAASIFASLAQHLRRLTHIIALRPGFSRRASYKKVLGLQQPGRRFSRYLHVAPWCPPSR